MKYFKKISVALLLIVIAMGCDHVVNITQKGSLPPARAFESVQDLQQGLIGVYAQLDIFEGIWFSNVFTDEISFGVGNGGQGRALYHWQLTPASNMASAAWNEDYDAINKATRLIVAARDVKPSSGEKTMYNSIVGQVHAIRAFEYFNLLKFYSEDLTDDSSPGVILFKGVPAIDAELPRSTTGEVFKFINADLDTAATLIPSYSSFNKTTRFTQEAITALRARMSLYRGDYQKAKTYSQTILDHRQLSDPNTYVQMWFKRSTRGEMIFELKRVINDGYDQQVPNFIPAGHGWLGDVFAQVSVNNGAQFEVSRSLWNLLKPNDVRRLVISAVPFFKKYGQGKVGHIVQDYSNMTSSQFFNADLNFAMKYAGYVFDQGHKPLLVNQPVFRVSEMVLINAEAKAQLGSLNGPNSAAGMIHKLQKARFIGNSAPPMPHYASKKEALADILKQRRIELAFEGHRFFDLRRIGPEIGAGIDRATIDCKHVGACQGAPVPGQSYKYVLPIPTSEFNGNHNIKQNPGYGSTGGGS